MTSTFSSLRVFITPPPPTAPPVSVLHGGKKQRTNKKPDSSSSSSAPPPHPPTPLCLSHWRGIPPVSILLRGQSSSLRGSTGRARRAAAQPAAVHPASLPTRGYILPVPSPPPPSAFLTSGPPRFVHWIRAVAAPPFPLVRSIPVPVVRVVAPRCRRIVFRCRPLPPIVIGWAVTSSARRGVAVRWEGV